MESRRKFLKDAGMLAMAGFLLPKTSFLQNRNASIGLQLYTLGNLMTDDAKGTLEKLAAIGYREIESAGSQKGNYYGFSPKEFSSMVKDAGMHWRSAHVGGAPFSTSQIMKMAKTAEDSAKAKKFAEQLKNRPVVANLTDNYQQLADEAAEGGLDYLVCASIPVG
ncbi:MAG TPA: hypothetical protein VHO68_10220, partial [Bacteroidales bacterium]|nr:hypothetical protein [Bacteroidales bacterium]